MQMGEDDSIDDFHARLMYVTSRCHSLCDHFEEYQIVKKILRSLSSKFQSKQTAIEETQDLDTYSLDELIVLALKPSSSARGTSYRIGD